MSDDRYSDQDDDELVVEEVVIEEIEVEPEPLLPEGEGYWSRRRKVPTSPVARKSSPKMTRLGRTSPGGRRRNPPRMASPTSPAAGARTSGTRRHLTLPRPARGRVARRRPARRGEPTTDLTRPRSDPGPSAGLQVLRGQPRRCSSSSSRVWGQSSLSRRERTVGQQPAVRLTGGAIVGLVVGVGDPLHR